ncbi:MAG: Hsp70 family protein, partial [Firmicutes bacterium]|nr:Hsp70 family protein [Bacillota bacterium]
RELADLRNECDSLIYSVEKTMKELGEKADPALAARVNEAKEELAKAMSGAEAAELRAKKEKLERALHELSTAVYQRVAQGAARPAGQAEQGPSGEAGKTVDADYHVVDDEGKK